VAYYIYKTKGLILKEDNIGEADKHLSFFTKDFGRVEVLAQGIRYLKSKLRYQLYGFSFLKLCFVWSRRSNFWRLIDAEEIESLEAIKKNFEKTQTGLRILSLLDRLIRGQEPDIRFWTGIKRIFLILDKNHFSPDDLKSFELWAAWQILAFSGYAQPEEAASLNLLKEIKRKRRFWASRVKKILNETQL
jgi:DNA repair protein RecO (recombination protein O)